MLLIIRSQTIAQDSESAIYVYFMRQNVLQFIIHLLFDRVCNKILYYNTIRNNSKFVATQSLKINLTHRDKH